MAIVAKAMNRPFYVVAESFKFSRMYPLTQNDIPWKSSKMAKMKKENNSLNYINNTNIEPISSDQYPTSNILQNLNQNLNENEQNYDTNINNDINIETNNQTSIDINNTENENTNQTINENEQKNEGMEIMAELDEKMDFLTIDNDNQIEDKESRNESKNDRFITIENDRVRDYTPPQYITLLFTDLGILTPSAVSDELIKLYQ